MASMEHTEYFKKLLSGERVGILLPHLSSHWLIKFKPSKSILIQDCFDLLTAQTIKSKIDLMNDVVEIELEQPLFYYEFYLLLIKELADNEIDLFFFDPRHPEEPFLKIEDTKLITHDFILDYKNYDQGKQIVTHTLKFALNFNRIRERVIVQLHDRTITPSVATLESIPTLNDETQESHQQQSTV